MNLTAVYVQDGPWIVGWIEEVPGAMSQGATLEEARENLRDALALLLETLRSDSAAQLADQSVVGRETFSVAA